MKTLLKNAYILTMENEKIIHGDILINNNRIESIKENIDILLADQVIECDNNLLMPGFKNVHAHGAMTFLRNRSDDVPLQKWLFEEVFPYENKLTSEQAYIFNKIAILEYLSSGITASLDQYLFPYETIKASLDMGFRTNIILVHDSKRSYVSLLNEWEDLIKTYNFKKDSLIRVFPGVHAEYTLLDEQIRLSKEIIEKYHLPFFSHNSETYQEVVDSYNRHKLSPTQYFDSLGLYKYGGGLFHGIYVSNEDIDIIQKQNLSIISCPGSNAKLASGICPLRKLLDNSINIALGTDGAASNNSLDMFKEMYLASALSKLVNKDPSSIPSFEILKMATVNGSKAMQLNEAMYLKENQLADIIMIDLSNPSMRPIHNVINALVYSGSKSLIKMTMINGKILYKDNVYFLEEDIDKLYENCQKYLSEIFLGN